MDIFPIFGLLLIIALLAFLLSPFILYARFRTARKEMTTRITTLEHEVGALQTMLHNNPAAAQPAEPLAPETTTTETNTAAADQLDVRILAEEPSQPEPIQSAQPEPISDYTYASQSEPVAAATVVEPTIAEPITDSITIDAADTEPETDAETDWSLPLIGWFMRSNTLVQIGIVILFFGIGFLLKYVADLGVLTIPMRHVAAATGGVALTATGWAMLNRARFYGLALQGAGLGIIYLTTFFAFRVYGILGAGLAFPILVALGIICAALALINNERALAFLAMIGAFLAPFLASDNTGSHVMLFSYFAAVNLAVLAIAWFKAWRSLNLASFLFTLAGGLTWGITSYRAEHFNSTEPFVILFFAFYLLIAILYGWRKAQDPTATRLDLLDTTIVFGNPFAIFAVQTVLMETTNFWENGAGISAAAMGSLYAILASALLMGGGRSRSNVADPAAERHPLTEAFLFLGFFFLAISIPLIFEPKVTAATWAVSGAIWVWMGTQRGRTWNKLFGLLAQIGAGIFFLVDYIGEYIWFNETDLTPFANPYYIGSILLAGAGLFSAYQLWRGKRSVLDIEESVTTIEGRWPIASALTMLWGLGWWFSGGILQLINLYLPYSFADTLDELTRFASAGSIPENMWTILLLFIAGSAALFELTGRALNWSALRRPMLLLLPALMGFSLIQLAYVPHHFAGLGWLIWPAALALFYWILTQQQRDFGSTESRFSGFSLAHAGSFWLVTFLLAWFAGWFADQQFRADTWVISAVIAACAIMILLASLLIKRLPQPFSTQLKAYVSAGVAPVALFALGWTLLVHGSNSGDIFPARYIPLFNPLDLAYVGLFTALFIWLRQHAQPTRRILGRTWGVLGFIALNLLIARAIHHTAGVPFTWNDLFYFPPLQMVYSVLWGALALTLMFWSRRNGERILWGSGALILALTIAKLFLVDLANSDSIARIVSFIGVGLLVMVIAYFAPAPQRRELEEATT